MISSFLKSQFFVQPTEAKCAHITHQAKEWQENVVNS